MAWKGKRIIEHDPVLGRTEYFWYDDVEQRWGYEVDWSVNVDRVLEDNKRKFNATDERAGWKGDWHRIASLPAPVAQQVWKLTNGGKDQEALRRWLNDPDNLYFKVRPGRV